jgi:hypothetical protein
MTYTKPQLFGYKAITTIQGSSKSLGQFEQNSTTLRTQPAYEADE